MIYLLPLLLVDLVKLAKFVWNFFFRIDDRVFVANLICLPLSGLDFILGIDWLSTNYVILNCSDKSIIFSSILSSEHVTSMYFYLNSLVLNRCKIEI